MKAIYRRPDHTRPDAAGNIRPMAAHTNFIAWSRILDCNKILCKTATDKDCNRQIRDCNKLLEKFRDCNRLFQLMID